MLPPLFTNNPDALFMLATHCLSFIRSKRK